MEKKWKADKLIDDLWHFKVVVQTQVWLKFHLAFFKSIGDKWNVVLLISAHNLNYKNCWCGEWLSWWNLEKTDDHTYNLKGKVRANTYYYEEGNVQFNLASDFDEISWKTATV